MSDSITVLLNFSQIKLPEKVRVRYSNLQLHVNRTFQCLYDVLNATDTHVAIHCMAKKDVPIAAMLTVGKVVILETTGPRIVKVIIPLSTKHVRFSKKNQKH